MHQIKFRAWDTKKQQMTGDDFAVTSLGAWLRPIHGYKIKLEDVIVKELWKREYTNLLIVMQYTGLKDKNGKEVYEGDIIQVKANLKKWVVVWMNCGFWLELILEKGSYREKYSLSDHERMVSATNSTYEIIGNVYENPELQNSQSVRTGLPSESVQ